LDVVGTPDLLALTSGEILRRMLLRLARRGIEQQRRKVGSC